MSLNDDLPQDEVTTLTALYLAQETAELRARVLALRSREWPLRAIGNPLGVSRQAVSNWVDWAQAHPSASLRADELLDEVPRLPENPKNSFLSFRRVSLKISQKDSLRLRELVPTVARLRSTTSSTSPVAQANREFQDLLHTYVTKRGVTAAEAARAAGVTRRTVTTHLAKRTS